MELFIDRFESDIGPLLIVSDATAVCALDYGDYESRMAELLAARYGRFSLRENSDPLGVGRRLAAYMTGKLEAVRDIPVNTGGTPFQRRVWSALRQIPAGETTTYGDLARQLGNANASRAVGLANSLNPIAIVIPCHRVIGANGKLTGYAGGLERKRWLLAHELTATAGAGTNLPF